MPALSELVLVLVVGVIEGFGTINPDTVGMYSVLRTVLLHGFGCLDHAANNKRVAWSSWKEPQRTETAKGNKIVRQSVQCAMT